MSRKFVLSISCCAFVAVGVLASLYPFVVSWNPNSTSYEVIDINLSDLSPGSSVDFGWQGKPVTLYKPNEEMKRYLVSLNEITNGPDYTMEDIPDFFVYVTLSTHLGCGLADTQGSWPGSRGTLGYHDPCHRGFWDYAGRLIPSLHGGAGLNDLTLVSDYVWISDETIRIEGLTALTSGSLHGAR